MEKVRINTEYIKLGQFLKFTGTVEKGSDAKEIISKGLVRVNGNVETRRGRKLKPGDEIELDGQKYLVEK